MRKSQDPRAKGASTNIHNEHKGSCRGSHINIDPIPFPEIVAELGISEREVLRWARARARGKTFRGSADYRAYALEVERRHRLIDYVLFSSDDLYRDGVFKNARRAVA